MTSDFRCVDEFRGAAIVDASLGASHGAAVDGLGGLWTWGSGEAVGHSLDHHEPVSMPKKVDRVRGAVGVACGDTFTVAVVGYSRVVEDTEWNRLQHVEEEDANEEMDGLPSLADVVVEDLVQSLDAFNALRLWSESVLLESDRLAAACDEFLRCNMDVVLALNPRRGLELKGWTLEQLSKTSVSAEPVIGSADWAEAYVEARAAEEKEVVETKVKVKVKVKTPPASPKVMAPLAPPALTLSPPDEALPPPSLETCSLCNLSFTPTSRDEHYFGKKHRAAERRQQQQPVLTTPTPHRDRVVPLMSLGPRPNLSGSPQPQPTPPTPKTWTTTNISPLASPLATKTNLRDVLAQQEVEHAELEKESAKRRAEEAALARLRAERATKPWSPIQRPERVGFGDVAKLQATEREQTEPKKGKALTESVWGASPSGPKPSMASILRLETEQEEWERLKRMQEEEECKAKSTTVQARPGKGPGRPRQPTRPHPSSPVFTAAQTGNPSPAKKKKAPRKPQPVLIRPQAEASAEAPPVQ